MANDDDRFRIRPGKVRDRGAAHSPRVVRQRPKTFIGEVHQAIRRAGGNPNRLAGTGKGSGRFNARGRGAQVAAGLKGRNGWSRDGGGVRTRSRRVAVKARVVKLNPQRGAARGRQFVSGKAVDAHLRYLERDGVTRDGEKGQVYSADQDVADGPAFLDRGREDRHQFRFIVSAEEGVELSDLRQTTCSRRSTMRWSSPIASASGAKPARLPRSSTAKASRRPELAFHPTVKPVALIADAMRDVTRRGEIVLDPFAGSGTIFVAAEKTGRQAFGMEIEPRYCDVIVRRWQTYAGRPARLHETNGTFEDVEGARGSSATGCAEPATSGEAAAR